LRGRWPLTLTLSPSARGEGTRCGFAVGVKAGIGDGITIAAQTSSDGSGFGGLFDAVHRVRETYTTGFDAKERFLTDLRDIAERSMIREAGKDRTPENTEKYLHRQG
jgi:hypothetical protein